VPAGLQVRRHHPHPINNQFDCHVNCRGSCKTQLGGFDETAKRKPHRGYPTRMARFCSG
jgi:hypothetical protein